MFEKYAVVIVPSSFSQEPSPKGLSFPRIRSFV